MKNKNTKLRVGIVFDKPEEYAHFPILSKDQFDEFEPKSTIDAMAESVLFLGHQPILIGGPLKLFKNKPDVDVLWNIGEGFGTRNREAWTPILAELWRIPFIGSDALTLSVTLDKARTKQIARSIGIPTADWCVANFEEQFIPDCKAYPLFLKPRYEGTAKGISKKSIVKNEDELRIEVIEQWRKYQQDILIETWLKGAEYTCAVSGNPLKPHAVLERGLDPQSKVSIHTLGLNDDSTVDYELSNDTSKDKIIQEMSLKLCKELDVKDFARLDFKCDSDGNVYFLEINPLPTFAIDNTFAILAELENKKYPEFLGTILQLSLKRIFKHQNQ